MRIIVSLFLCVLSANSIAQTFIVKPYVQDATPNSIRILWETSSGDESVVNWGISEELGNTTIGEPYLSEFGFIMHNVLIEGLDRFTNYYYQVTTGGAESGVSMFKTPPFASDNEDFRFVAISDMQKSSADPNVFDEVIHEGILEYLEELYRGETAENLALILIPGDLVDYGNTYHQWEEDFFNPAADLLESVPVYPVMGNHEANTSYFFQYFHLPENGFEEHWWWKDYGNVRFIGLDSNYPYNGDDQLEWLDEILESTSQADSIDFVFAELHHPFKSELWTPGESDFTGEVVERLEEFSTNSGKPSIHFFGHTHGYSRGQSRDHKHVWINVATAGGAIDYWGEWPQFDYEEFSVSDDDWGFVMVDVEAGDDPKFTVKRLSRGDNFTDLDNEEIDRFTVTKADYEVSTPSAQYPVDIEVSPECVILCGTDFTLEDMHGASHWQVTSVQGDYSNPVVDFWEQHENIYFNEDLQAGESLTDEQVSGIEANSQYWWRVRYRDKELNWSDWSEEVSFTTGESSFSPNLLINPGSEDLLNGWLIDEGICESMLAYDCAGTAPYTGDRYFAVGGLCEESPVGRMHQDIDISMYSDSVDMGAMEVSFGAMMSDWSGADVPDMRLQFLTMNGTLLESTDYIAGAQSSWLMIESTANIPVLTRQIRCELRGTRNEGTDNDCYFDDVYVRLGSESECDTSIVSIEEPVYALTFSAYPNPANESATIVLPRVWDTNTEIRLADSTGRKVPVETSIEESKITVHRNSLPSGIYSVTIINGSKWGHTSIVFE